MSHPSCRGAFCRVAALVAAWLSVTSVATAIEEVTVDYTNRVVRRFQVTLPAVNFTIGSTGKAGAFASAYCEHGSKALGNPQEGLYYQITRPPTPPAVTTQDITTGNVTAKVEHAEGWAHASVSPEITVNGNLVAIEVTVFERAYAKRWECPYGPSSAFASALALADPIVFGTGSYLSYTGATLDAIPTDTDGLNRYVEQEVLLGEGVNMTGGKPGLSPTTSGGKQYSNGLTISQYVRAGSDDDPNNTAGTMVYELKLTPEPGGGVKVVWTPGTDTVDFAFSFDRSAAQIEQDVRDWLAAGSVGDLPVAISRITMLADDIMMPTMTIMSSDNAEVFNYATNNPYRVEKDVKWWQGPDLLAGSRPSECLSPTLRADDFECNDPDPIRAVRWWGIYAGETGTKRPDVSWSLPFDIRFYASDGSPHPMSLPVTGPEISLHLVSASRFFLGWNLLGDAIYEFNAPLCLSPFYQTPGNEYFISICDSSDPAWEWQLASTANLDQPAMSTSISGPWMPEPFPDLSFVLMTGSDPDFDDDGDVDFTDYIRFAAAFNGPFVYPYDFAADYNDGCDVDLTDYLVFQGAYTGPQNLGSVNTSPVPRLGTVTIDLVPASPTVIAPGDDVDYEIWASCSLENDGLYAATFDLLTDTGEPQDPSSLSPPAAYAWVNGGAAIGDDLAGVLVGQNLNVAPTIGFAQGAPLQLATGTANSVRLPKQIGRYTVRTDAGAAGVIRDVGGGFYRYPPAELVHGPGFTIDVVVDCDFDDDGDVDLTDFAAFSACFNGPNRAPAAACAVDADFDHDNDVDLADFGGFGFAVCYNGPNRPPVQGALYCADNVPVGP
ncbi:MAG: hypothetical protein JXA69_01470 [Phycisphaerae bacterium]|nr:hypothetical protein [Phycisphaerae bacterium]